MIANRSISCANQAPVALPVILELDGERPMREEVRDQALATSIRLVELGLVEWR
jgi:hypothetical protein